MVLSGLAGRPGVPPIPLDPDLESWLHARLEDVERLLRETVTTADPFISEAARHLVEAGGKRFRPLVALLAAQYGDREASGVIPGAVVAELTHLATLYHDDVMDEAPLRRGAPSANARWTNTIAILTGDYLFARASDLLADLGPVAVRLQARTFEQLVQGQIRETVGPGPDDDPVEHYLGVLRDKTGSLIATSARFGAMFAGADAGVVQAVARYGELIGIAFQLSDDLLDVASETADSGKTPGTDLREGVATLPVQYAVRGQDPTSLRLRELLAGPLSDDDVDEALRLLRGHPAMAEARQAVRDYTAQAKGCLQALPPGAARAALDALCEYVATRTG
jgi:heptaprenyl diphosphate synthase